MAETQYGTKHIRTSESDFLTSADWIEYVAGTPRRANSVAYYLNQLNTAISNVNVSYAPNIGTSTNYLSYAQVKQIYDNYVSRGGDVMTGALTVPELNVTGNSTFTEIINGNINGNAATATKLQTARSITVGGTTRQFDGTGNISFSLSDIGVGGYWANIPLSQTASTTTNPTFGALTVSGTANITNVIGSLQGNASTASRLLNARNITIGSTTRSFDGTGNISFSRADIGYGSNLTFSIDGAGVLNSSGGTYTDAIYNTSAPLRISYNSIIPPLGVIFLQQNFFIIENINGSQTQNLFTSTAGSTTYRMVLYFRFKKPDGEYITPSTTDPASFNKDSQIVLKFDGTAINTTTTNTFYYDTNHYVNFSSNNYYINNSTTPSSNYTSGGIIFKTPTGIAKTTRRSYTLNFSVIYGGATITKSISMNLYRPIFSFCHSVEPTAANLTDSTIFGSSGLLSKATTASSMSITLGGVTETSNYKGWLNKTSENIAQTINSSVNQYVIVLVPATTTSSNDFSVSGLKNSLQQDCYLAIGSIIDNSTYGKYYAYYSASKQAKGASPVIYLK